MKINVYFIERLTWISFYRLGSNLKSLHKPVLGCLNRQNCGFKRQKRNTWKLGEFQTPLRSNRLKKFKLLQWYHRLKKNESMQIRSLDMKLNNLVNLIIRSRRWKKCALVWDRTSVDHNLMLKSKTSTNRNNTCHSKKSHSMKTSATKKTKKF